MGVFCSPVGKKLTLIKYQSFNSIAIFLHHSFQSALFSFQFQMREKKSCKSYYTFSFKHIHCLLVKKYSSPENIRRGKWTKIFMVHLTIQFPACAICLILIVKESVYSHIRTKLSFCLWHFCMAFLVRFATTWWAAKPVVEEDANLCQSNTFWFITQRFFSPQIFSHLWNF